MKLNSYQKIALTTVFATLFLIFVGGLVRAAGAGLGCPDWPQCFGMWIPPTSAADLPAQFNADQFNAFKTWTEYLNRLTGVVIGFLILGTFIFSFRYQKKEPAVFYSSAAAFVLVLVQGWLGGQVVMTGLNEWLITLHMLLAMVIISVLLYATFKATRQLLTVSIDHNVRQWLFWTGIALLSLTTIQLVLGTQVREAIDVIKNSGSPPPREVWISNIGAISEVHRSFSWTILLAGAAVFYLTRWKTNSDILSNVSTGIFIVILFQLVLGIGLYYLGIPESFQVLHLSGAALMICLEFLFILILQINPQPAIPQGSHD